MTKGYKSFDLVIDALKMARCYCYVTYCNHCDTHIERCSNEPFNGTDFCKDHLIYFNLSMNNMSVTPDRISFLSPTGKVILDDTWFRKNERYFKGYETKLIPGCAYTWVFVYFMVKRIEAKLKRFEFYTPVTKIQRVWKRCITNPEYIMCKKRLQKEFESCEQDSRLGIV